MSYGEKIKEFMKKANLSLEQLSKRTGISEYVLNKYISDERVPKAADLIDISFAIGVEPDVLIGD